MKKTSRFLFCLSILCVSAIASQASWAQVKGQYVPKQEKPEEDTLPATVPRVFSSQVGSVKQAEKLDLKYYDLTVSLAGFSEVDQSYRASLMEQMEPFKFQVTRRKEEFTKGMDDAKAAVKDNYKKMKALIEAFETQIDEELLFYPEGERKTIEQAGEQAVKSFKKKSDEYFKLQARFIKTYDRLVRFILSNGGAYYYDSASKRLSFYNAGQYNTFGNMVDELNKISFDQNLLIKSFAAGPPL